MKLLNNFLKRTICIEVTADIFRDKFLFVRFWTFPPFFHSMICDGRNFHHGLGLGAVCLVCAKSHVVSSEYLFSCAYQLIDETTSVFIDFIVRIVRMPKLSSLSGIVDYK